MNILETIKNRRSVRNYKSNPIPEKLIDRLIEALIWAPSAGNLQSRKFYFVFNEKIKKDLAEAALGQDFIGEVPLAVVGCTDDKTILRYGERGKNLYSICDVSASIQNMMLVAQHYNLGTCWVGAFDEEEVAEILDLPENLRPIVIVPVGYPAERPLPPKRKKVEEVITKIE